MAKMFELNNKEAIRIKAKKYDGSKAPEVRKFSIDPQITSYEILQSILMKAFDINEEFSISYHMCDDLNHEIYSAILSDWDLDAAFLRAHNECLASATSEPNLCLRIDIKSNNYSNDYNVMNITTSQPKIKISDISKPVAAQRLLPGIIKNHVEKTFSLFQRALNLNDESSYFQPPRLPLSDSEFRNFLNPIGQLVHGKELRSVVYAGGIDPSLRKVVWKHLLNVYPEGMSGKERMDYMKLKANEYVILRETWKQAMLNGPITDDLAYTTGMIRKDVLRTDRHHSFYSGPDDGPNITALFNILTTYALNHPKISYCQGMSDIASPLLVVMNDEAHAYICFCALMQRLGENFLLDGIAMTKKFTHLAEALLYYDIEFYNYLKINQADDLLFCYRWLLLEMKREFAFDDALHMLEVLWSSLPATPPEKELKLYDVLFKPSSITPPISPLIKTPRENAYTKVCALRKQYSSLNISENVKTKYKNFTKRRQIHSLDEPTRVLLNTEKFFKSLDESSLNKSKSGYSLKNGEYDNEKNGTNENPKMNSENSLSISNSSINSSIMSPDLNSDDWKSDYQTTSEYTSDDDKKSIDDDIIAHNSEILSGYSMPTDKQISINTFNDFHLNFNYSKCSNAQAKQLGSNVSLDTLNKVNSLKDLKEIDSFKDSRSSLYSQKDDSQKDLNSSPLIPLDNTVLSIISKNDETSSIIPINSSIVPLDETSVDAPSNSSFKVNKVGHFKELKDRISQKKFLNEKSNIKSYFNKCKDEINKYNLSDETKSGSKDKNPFKRSPITNLKFDRQASIEKYFLMASNLTQEIKEELKNFNKSSSPKECTSPKDLDSPKLINKNNRDDIFVWENPLHQQSPADSESRLSEKDLQKKLEINEMMPNTFLTSNHEQQMTNSCEEVTENVDFKHSCLVLPPPNEFGGGNPFLMLLCVTLLLQHRDFVVRKQMDYNEMAMHFDKMVRKHNVIRVLNQARQMYAVYIKQYSRFKKTSPENVNT